MRFLTTLMHGSILVHHDDPCRVDTGEIDPARSDDGVEVPFGPLDDRRFPLAGLLGAERIRLRDDDLPAGELDRPCVDSREAELEHAAGPSSQELDDPRRRGSSEARRHARHGQTLTFVYRGASRRG